MQLLADHDADMQNTMSRLGDSAEGRLRMSHLAQAVLRLYSPTIRVSVPPTSLSCSVSLTFLSSSFALSFPTFHPHSPTPPPPPSVPLSILGSVCVFVFVWSQ